MMSSVFIDHKILRPYYQQCDIIVTNIYDMEDPSHNGLLVLPGHEKNIIFEITNYELIISFYIESKKVCAGYVHMNGFVVSQFTILKDNNEYPHLMLRCG